MVHRGDLEAAHLGQFSSPSKLGVGAGYHRDPNIVTYNNNMMRGVEPSSRQTGLNMVTSQAAKKPTHTIGAFLASPQSGSAYYPTTPYEMRQHRGIINVLGADKLLYRKPNHSAIQDMHKAPFMPPPLASKRSKEPSGKYLAEVTPGDLEYVRSQRPQPYQSDGLRQILPGKGKKGGPGYPNTTIGPMPEYMYDDYEKQSRVVSEMEMGMGDGYRSSLPTDTSLKHGKAFGPQRKTGGLFSEDVYTDPRPATTPVYKKTQHPKYKSFSAPATRQGPRPHFNTIGQYPTYMSSPYLDNPWKNLSSIETRASSKLQLKTGKAVGSEKTVHGTLHRKVIRPIANSKGYSHADHL